MADDFCFSCLLAILSFLRGDRSLDGIYKKFGAIKIEIVGKIAEAVLEGLTYLYDVHRIIHRGAFHNDPVHPFRSLLCELATELLELTEVLSSLFAMR